MSELSPNPVRGGQISFTLKADRATRAVIRVIDDLGREVLSTVADVRPGVDTSIKLEIGNLASGSYLIAIDGNDEFVGRSFVIAR